MYWETEGISLKKALLTILALPLCVSLLAACGGKDNGDKPVNTADIAGENLQHKKQVGIAMPTCFLIFNLFYFRRLL